MNYDIFLGPFFGSFSFGTEPQNPPLFTCFDTCVLLTPIVALKPFFWMRLKAAVKLGLTDVLKLGLIVFHKPG